MDKIFGANLEFVREDDYVEYYLFPKLNETTSSDENEHEKEIRTQLENVREHCMKLVENLIKERNYIWHKDEFQLRIRTCTKQEMLLNDESTTTAATTKEKATNSKNAQEGKQNMVIIIIAIIIIIINAFCLCLFKYVYFVLYIQSVCVYTFCVLKRLFCAAYLNSFSFC